MRKFFTAFLTCLLICFTLPTQAAVADNLLEITAVNPGIIKPFEPIEVKAKVNSRQIQTVELWLSQTTITDITKTSQDVFPLTQAAVINNQVTLRRNAMPDLASGVYQLVLRSINGKSVIGEQAIPIVIVKTKLPTKPLAVLVPITVPPTSDEITPLRTFLATGVGEDVEWFIDGNTLTKLKLNQLTLAGKVNGIAATNPDPNVTSRFNLINLLRGAINLTQAQLTQIGEPDVKVAAWQLRHQLDGAGMRTAINAGLDYVIAPTDQAAIKYRVNRRETTLISIDPILPQLLARTTSSAMIKQYVLATSVLTNAAAIAPPPNWAPSFDQASAFFAGTKTAPWLQRKSTAAIASSLKAVSTSNISGSSPVFATKHMRNLDQANRLWRSLNSTTPAGVELELTEPMLATASNWWWFARPAGNKYTLQIKSQVAAELNQLKIASRNKVVLPANQGTIPVTVTNNRATNAKIEVAGLGLGTAVVRIESIQLEIPAGAKQVVELPIEVITPGSIYAQLLIQSVDGEPTAMPPTVLQIEVTKYRQVAQLVIYAAFGVLVLLSLNSIRTKVKRRRHAELVVKD